MYTQKLGALFNKGTAQSVTTAGPTDIALFIAGEQVSVGRVAFSVKTAPTVTAPVISVYKRAVVDSTAGQVLLTTITVPIATAAGTLVYKDMLAAKIPAGYGLAFVCTTAATAGDGYCLPLRMEDSPEVPLNSTNLLVSV